MLKQIVLRQIYNKFNAMTFYSVEINIDKLNIDIQVGIKSI